MSSGKRSIIVLPGTGPPEAGARSGSGPAQQSAKPKSSSRKGKKKGKGARPPSFYELVRAGQESEALTPEEEAAARHHDGEAESPSKASDSAPEGDEKERLMDVADPAEETPQSSSPEDLGGSEAEEPPASQPRPAHSPFTPERRQPQAADAGLFQGSTGTNTRSRVKSNLFDVREETATSSGTDPDPISKIAIFGSLKLQEKLRSLCTEFSDIFSETVHTDPANVPPME
jgi:hypothetical protein